MTGMLYKKSSDVARLATLRLAATIEEAPPAEVIVEPTPPSRQELELAKLKAENAELQRHIEVMQAQHADEIETAYHKALEEAASRHVRDDARLLDALDRAFSAAARQFDSFLSGSCGPAAAKLAAAGFGKLVALRQQDEDWLAQIVMRRLNAIAADAAITLHVAPDIGEAVEKALAAAGRTDVALKLDKSVSPGTARIALKLGEIVIDPSQGAAAIMAVLEDVERDDD